MKRVLCILFVVLMAVTIIGCRQRDTGPVTLRVAFWDQNQAPGIEKVLGEFTAETGIRTRIEITPWGDYWTSLEASATGGTLPDVFWMNTNEIQRYMSAGLLLDLTDRINRSSIASMANFPAEIVNIYNFRGRQFGIPKDIDTIALWYNKTHFQEAGVPLPTDNWTWNDLNNAARRLRNTGANRYGIVFTPGESQTGYWNFIYANNGYVIETPDRKRSGYDDPRTIEAMEFVISFIRDGVAPPLEMVAETDKMALMQSGMVSMATFGSWMLGTFARSDFFLQNCDVVMLPMGRTGTRATIYNGLGWTTAANTRHPEEAWKLLEFLSSERAQRRLAEEGVALSAYTGSADPFFRQFTAWDAAAYLRMLPYGVMRPYSINTGAWEYVSVQLLNEAFGLRRPVADVLREIAQRMNAMLADEFL